MNKPTTIAISIFALALGLGMSGNAHAYTPPSHACTAANEGEIYSVQTGPFRYGQPYRIIDWECSQNQWFISNIQLCDYYGSGCVSL
jgi:hypothetical protein